MNRKLYTIGYSGFGLEEFIDHLREFEIECLIDVREIPISRKRGFSKNALLERLQTEGMQYRHFRLLGSPRTLRHEVRETHDYRKFFVGVSNRLNNDDSQLQIAEAIDVSRRLRSCLMCCCPDWQFCHRKCVVEAMLGHTFFFADHLTKTSEPSIRRKAA